MEIVVMIYEQIDKLISYGEMTGLIKSSDKMYVRNRLLTKLKLDAFEETEAVCTDIKELDDILEKITDYAVKNGLIENDSVVYRDIFDTEIMDTLTPFPSTVIEKFNELYEKSSK